MNIIIENQTYRFQILFEIYKKSNTDIDFATDLQELAMNLGVGNRAFQSSYKYLYMQDLISMRPNMDNNGGGGSNYYASITHKGVKAVEEVFRFPEKASEYFPPYREMMM